MANETSRNHGRRLTKVFCGILAIIAAVQYGCGRKATATHAPSNGDFILHVNDPQNGFFDFQGHSYFGADPSELIKGFGQPDKERGGRLDYYSHGFWAREDKTGTQSVNGGPPKDMLGIVAFGFICKPLDAKAGTTSAFKPCKCIADTTPPMQLGPETTVAMIMKAFPQARPENIVFHLAGYKIIDASHHIWQFSFLFHNGKLLEITGHLVGSPPGFLTDESQRRLALLYFYLNNATGPGFEDNLGGMFNFVVRYKVSSINGAAPPQPCDFLNPNSTVKIPSQVTAAWINRNADYVFDIAGKSMGMFKRDKTLAVGREELRWSHGGMLYVIYADGHIENMPNAEAEKLVP